MVYFVPFSLLIAFGTVGVGIYVDVLSLSYIKGGFADQTIGWIEHKVAIFRGMESTLLLLWFLSAGITFLYTALVYKEARRLSLNEKVRVLNDLHLLIPSV